jgi:dihydrolipoamide dehydrogenase
MDYGNIPSCIYLEPEIACIGMTEKQAREKCPNVGVDKFPMAGNGKSLVEGDTDGMVKIIIDEETGEILGAHLYGKHVTDMIAEIALDMTLEATAEEIIHTIHPPPTVSESIPEAFMAAYGKALHRM